MMSLVEMVEIGTGILESNLTMHIKILDSLKKNQIPRNKFNKGCE
jgi:hypothetical protein